MVKTHPSTACDKGLFPGLEIKILWGEAGKKKFLQLVPLRIFLLGFISLKWRPQNIEFCGLTHAVEEKSHLLSE